MDGRPQSITARAQNKRRRSRRRRTVTAVGGRSASRLIMVLSLVNWAREQMRKPLTLASHLAPVHCPFLRFALRGAERLLIMPN